MSRSFKKAIIKDCGHQKKLYWKSHRRTNKSILHHYVTQFDFNIWCDEPALKNPKELINDYDYCDWVLDGEYIWTDSENKRKWRRK